MDFLYNSNWYFLFLAPIIPVALSFIWYHPSLFGKVVARNSGQAIGQIGNLARIGWVYLFGLLIAYMTLVLTVHQIGPHLLFFGEPEMSNPDYPAHAFLANFIDQYGDRHRSFGHGMVHGSELSFLLSLGVLGSSAVMEGRPIKNVWVHVGFWAICGALMGGVLAANF